MMNSIREEIERLSELCLPHENGPFLVIGKADVLAILDKYEVVADGQWEWRGISVSPDASRMTPAINGMSIERLIVCNTKHNDRIIVLREKGDQR